MKMRRRLVCCTRDRETSLDLDEQERIMTYKGLGSYILSTHSYENESGTSRGDECASDSLDEDASSCSSSNDAFGTFTSHWMVMNKDEQGGHEWKIMESPRHLSLKEKTSPGIQFSDVETLKERFAKLLLGEDVTGGHKGLSSALALSNAITNLGASIFGELWKLEPLPEETKSKWRREMEWLLSPTKYMVQLVPAKQNGANGQTMEIMIPKARADIHMNLPALQKLDSMLIETLDSMVSSEFWYAEEGSQVEGQSRTARQSGMWWLPSPNVPISSLSEAERNKLLYKGKVVHQVFKAVKSINEMVLLEMPVPTIIKDALPKSGRASIGEELYRMLSARSKSSEEMLNSLDLKSEHSVLETINRLEAAVLVWKDRIADQSAGKSPARTPLSLIKNPTSEQEKMQFLLDRAENLVQKLKTRHPNLPQTFLDVTKIRYGKDVGHSILEAYSRVLRNLAFRILSRIEDILQEDVLSNPTSPVPTSCFPGINPAQNSDFPVFGDDIRHSLIDHMNRAAGQLAVSNASFASGLGLSCDEHKTSSGTATAPYS